MTNFLASNPGISGTSVLSIPKTWDPNWFRSFVNNQLKGADVRNATGTNGIKVSGNISSPYATISIGAGPINIPGGATGSATVTIHAPPAGAGSIALSVIGNGTQNALGITGGNALAPLVLSGTNTQGYSIVFQGGVSGNTEYGGLGPGPINVTGAALNSMCVWAVDNGPVILGGFNGSYAALTTDATGSQAGVTITADAATALQVNGVASFAPITITNFAANTPAINFTNAAFTGAHTATFTASNKPGSATTAVNTWLPVQINGVTNYVPCWL